MMMDIRTFQDKLNEIKELASENAGILTGEQVKEFFTGLNPDREQLLQILKYLKVQGIAIEGLEDFDGEGVSPKEEKSAELTSEERAYLREYKASLPAKYDKEAAKRLFARLAAGEKDAKEELAACYLEVAADIAASMHGQEMILADLIQEANIGMLVALEKEEPCEKDDAWLREEIRKGIRKVLEEQVRRDFEDDCLVAKVENLESAVRDLSEGEDGTESKFTVGELAIILDMEIEEIEDVLRLTGDYEGENEKKG